MWINLLCNVVGNLFVTTLGILRRFVEPQDDSMSSPMRTLDDTALSGFARKTAESASDVVRVVHNLIMDVRDRYLPGCTTCAAPALNGALSIRPGYLILRLHRRQASTSPRRCTYAPATRLTRRDSPAKVPTCSS